MYAPAEPQADAAAPQADAAVAAPRVHAAVQKGAAQAEAHEVEKEAPKEAQEVQQALKVRKVHKACADWCDRYQFNCSAFPGMTEEEMGAWSML